MNLIIREATPEDVPAIGEICFDAFRLINEAHNFPPEIPTLEMAMGLMGMVVSLPGCYCVVAELDGVPVGSNAIWAEDHVAGIGPITVAPGVQNKSIGRRLMQAVLDYGREKEYASIRLVQAAFHNRSFSLYTKLGFDVQESIAVISGPALNLEIPGYAVRPATEADIPGCNDLCQRVHGHIRANELGGAIAQGNALVVEHDGRITGYSTTVGFFGHSVGESNEDLKALIGAVPEFAGAGFHLPNRNGDLLRWCFDHGLRVVEPLNLMSLGVYQQPKGAFLPSILY